jgi:hypothetical protein
VDILLKSFQALWQVAAVGLLLGAGLPALYAVGVRALNSNRVLLAAGSEVTSRPSRSGLVLAVLCFSVTALAVVFGIVVIIFGKQLFA